MLILDSDSKHIHIFLIFWNEYVLLRFCDAKLSTIQWYNLLNYSSCQDLFDINY